MRSFSDGFRGRNHPSLPPPRPASRSHRTAEPHRARLLRATDIEAPCRAPKKTKTPCCSTAPSSRTDPLTTYGSSSIPSFGDGPATSSRTSAAPVVALRVFGGLTAEEIADELSVSPRTVKSDWVTARGRREGPVYPADRRSRFSDSLAALGAMRSARWAVCDCARRGFGTGGLVLHDWLPAFDPLGARDLLRGFRGHLP
ncbi:MAG: ECF-type sigma factor [Myxococcota bacterium]|nr:ECF-type sigma factor [Myxococcota bacterium]